jgi:hypothetical protein
LLPKQYVTNSFAARCLNCTVFESLLLHIANYLFPPAANNCADTLNTLPVCADPSWTLYIGNYNYFCCALGQVGVLPQKGSSVAAGLCVDSNVNPAASILATPVTSLPHHTDYLADICGIVSNRNPFTSGYKFNFCHPDD